MEGVELQVLIAGAIVPFLISLLKRWVKLSREQISLLVMGSCFIIATVYEFIENSPTYEEFLGRIATVYGTSQLVYWSVLKLPSLDEIIEGS